MKTKNMWRKIKSTLSVGILACTAGQGVTMLVAEGIAVGSALYAGNELLRSGQKAGDFVNDLVPGSSGPGASQIPAVRR
jgi:hypothetical protein